LGERLAYRFTEWNLLNETIQARYRLLILQVSFLQDFILLNGVGNYSCL